MRSTLALMLGYALIAGCAPRERLTPIFPPSADLVAVTRPMPVAPPDIVTSARAAAQYDIEIQAWGMGLFNAGGRICRWALRSGAPAPKECPAAPVPDPEN